MTMESQRQSLPDEVICRILSFSTPLDVVRARLASKHLCEITYDREIWKTLYTNARLLRPPGPFPFQSTQLLERILVQSARFGQSWTTQPLQERLHVQIPLGRPQLAPPKLICGRWLIGGEEMTKIVKYDISKPNSAQVIWEMEPGRTIIFWDSCFITSERGELIYILILKGSGFSMPSSQVWELVEFRVNRDSDEWDSGFAFELPTTLRTSFSATLYGDMGPLIYIHGLRLIFDTRTRIIYEFPEFNTGLEGMVLFPNHFTNDSVLITSTYIIVTTFNVVPTSSSTVLTQAFTVPSDSSPVPAGRLPVLRLTHECLLTHGAMVPPTLIRDSIVDPVANSTNVRFLGRFIENEQMRIACIDLTLPDPCNDKILPIFIDIRDIGLLVTLAPRYSLSLSHDASDDGYVRGLCRIHHPIYDGETEDMRYYTIKFTVDGTQDECQTVVGDLVPYRTAEGIDKSVCVVSFDAMRGRICYAAGSGNAIRGFDTAYIVDIH